MEVRDVIERNDCTIPSLCERRRSAAQLGRYIQLGVSLRRGYQASQH
jgi:hypothetical protein